MTTQVTNNLDALAAHYGAFIAKLQPTARRVLAREIAISLRRSQQQRIADQLNPDGSPFTPRKPQLRSKKGKIRRTMFTKLRTARYLKTEATAAYAAVSFVGRVQRIASVHQFGLRDRVRPNGPEAQYPARALLGFTDTEISTIESLVINQLSF